ncbi:MAG TPA: tellurite resistance TerB family protein [Sphingomonadales bacterium]|nr:tellurite resistance TerB family protein [Sphingomonadales bacterium]
MTTTISPHTALVYVMVVVSAADRRMTDAELKAIGGVVRTVPAFAGYPEENLLRDARNCAAIVENEEEGLNAVLGLAREALPATHLDTAYLLACEVAAADGHFTREEIRILEMIRHGLGLDRLTASAIERAVTARFRGF